jgi:predicted DCC family thiol-disulfide oxidoreductase YuxK
VAIVLYVFWLPLPAWTAALLLFPAAASWLHGCPRAKVALILDGGCRMCRRSLAVVAALDWAQRVAPFNALHWREVGRHFPGLREADCMRDLHVVDAGGRVTAGFDAWRALSWRLPLLLPLAPLLHLPPVAALGRRVYRRIADTRQRDGCGDELCSPGSARALQLRSLAGQREDAAG